MNLREAAQQALEALEYVDGYNGWVDVSEEITTLRAALAEDVPETNFGNMAQAVDLKRDDIIRLARGEGFDDFEQDEMLLRFAALAAAAEREVCAQIADEWATREQKQFGNGGPGAAIRARGNQ